MNVKWIIMHRVAFACLGLLAVGEAQAQCYRMQCDAQNKCKAEPSNQGGNCCCQVNCSGGEGGSTCTCTTSCLTPCGVSCPPCGACPESAAARGPGFVLSPERHALVGEKHMLAAQVLLNLSENLSNPVYSGVAEGRSNASKHRDYPFHYSYSYTVHIKATDSQAVMQFIFDIPEGASAPLPVRVTVDEAGNVVSASLSSQEAERIRSQTAAACSQGREVDGLEAAILFSPSYRSGPTGRLVVLNY